MHSCRCFLLLVKCLTPWSRSRLAGGVGSVRLACLRPVCLFVLEKVDEISRIHGGRGVWTGEKGSWGEEREDKGQEGIWTKTYRSASTALALAPQIPMRALHSACNTYGTTQHKR